MICWPVQYDDSYYEGNNSVLGTTLTNDVYIYSMDEVQDMVQKRYDEYDILLQNPTDLTIMERHTMFICHKQSYQI